MTEIRRQREDWQRDATKRWRQAGRPRRSTPMTVVAWSMRPTRARLRAASWWTVGIGSARPSRTNPVSSSPTPTPRSAS
ncbi:hypothetical protein [Novosphingobium sp. EMRT-2]|uniref:hypothetical protein n=1 Tax=Novosphingobium sp. EMRT-2 TaxID=2571749 RepID=UPI0035141C9C